MEEPQVEYIEEELQDPSLLEKLENEIESERNTNVRLNNALSNFQNIGGVDQNLVQWQLETEDILDKIEHFVRGDMVKQDDSGNVYYEAPTNEDLVILNEYGVNSIMQILGNYVNKIHMLSYYTPDRVNEVLADLGDELALFLFCNYEKMGLTTEFKKSRYTMLVLNILHLIESVYRKALFGKEREEANTGRLITQTNRYPGGDSMQLQQQPVKKKRFGIFG